MGETARRSSEGLAKTDVGSSGSAGELEKVLNQNILSHVLIEQVAKQEGIDLNTINAELLIQKITEIVENYYHDIKDDILSVIFENGFSNYNIRVAVLEVIKLALEEAQNTVPTQKEAFESMPDNANENLELQNKPANELCEMILASGIFDEEGVQIVRLRFGIGCTPIDTVNALLEQLDITQGKFNGVVYNKWNNIFTQTLIKINKENIDNTHRAILAHLVDVESGFTAKQIIDTYNIGLDEYKELYTLAQKIINEVINGMKAKQKKKKKKPNPTTKPKPKSAPVQDSKPKSKESAPTSEIDKQTLSGIADLISLIEKGEFSFVPVKHAQALKPFFGVHGHPKQSMQQIADANGVNINTLYRWKKVIMGFVQWEIASQNPEKKEINKELGAILIEQVMEKDEDTGEYEAMDLIDIVYKHKLNGIQKILDMMKNLDFQSYGEYRKQMQEIYMKLRKYVLKKQPGSANLSETGQALLQALKASQLPKK